MYAEVSGKKNIVSSFFSLIRNGGERREGSTTAETVRDQNK